MLRFKYCCAFLLFFMMQCESEVPVKKTSFYYWKTNYQLGDFEKKYLTDVPPQKIYFKAFDVIDHDPVGVLQWKDTVLPFCEYVPTVFIDYEVFKRIDTAANQKLAQNIYKLVKGICVAQNFEPQEIQIDCDWTAGVKQNYFYFLEYLKGYTKKNISCTIRLHQIKYKKNTGVPPCDYGVLMCYNMGNLKSPTAQNSIYNFEVLKSYLDRGSYELPLKAALPIFNWMLWYRGEQFMGILPRQKYFDKIKAQFEAQPGHTFVVKKARKMGAHTFLEGDLIRDETVSQEELKSLKKYLDASKFKLSDEIIYFSLDRLNLMRYEKNLFNP